MYVACQTLQGPVLICFLELVRLIDLVREIEIVRAMGLMSMVALPSDRLVGSETHPAILLSANAAIYVVAAIDLGAQ